MSDLECPYCEKDCEVCHDDGFGYEEGIKHQMECPHCGKSFVFETSISFYYEPEKADCLNGSKHKWKQSRTFPREFSVMYCEMCGEERKPTDKEMAVIMSS
jgi:transposase-like protein